jgi:hypothetical protein
MDYTQQRAFAEEIYQAAINIGLSDVQARVAAAQASQETQYGRHVAGNNYFGIKAGNSWDGPSQSVGTWEEINGRRVNIRDDFRVYETPEESLRDWASLMERNFPDVMSATTFDNAVQGLNNGRLGRYATDSRYTRNLGWIERNILDEVEPRTLAPAQAAIRDATRPAAPPIPATSAQMSAARPSRMASAPTATAVQGAPMQERTIGGFVNRGQVQLGPNTNPIDTLSEPAQRMLSGIQQLGTAPTLTINSGARTQADFDRLMAQYNRGEIPNPPARDGQHQQGNALDISLRGMTPDQRTATLNAAIRGGARGIGATDTMLHVDTRPEFDQWGYEGRAIAPWVRDSQQFDNLRRGAQYFPDTPGPNATTAIRGDGSLEAIPGITPRPDRRDMTFDLAAPTITSAQRAALSDNSAGRAAPVTPVTSRPLPAASPSRDTMANAYQQMAASRMPSPTSRRIDQGFAAASRAPIQAALPSPSTSGQIAQPIATSAQASPRINQAFNDALSLRAMPSPMYRASQPGSFGTPAPSRSPTDFQYSSAPRLAAQAQLPQAPVQTPRAPQQPSMRTIADQYGMRALQNEDPFASPQNMPSVVPGPVAPRPQFGSVPNPMARPANMGQMTAPINIAPPRSRAMQVPNPMARPSFGSDRNPLEAAFQGFNNWTQSLMNAPRMVGNAFASPMQAISNAFGGNNRPMNIAPLRQILRQGTNLPSSNTANWQDNTGLPTYASVTGNSGGTGASAHDAWADSLGSSFYR